MGARTAPAPRLVELFLDMLASERGGAKNTLAAYARDLEDLSSFLAAKRRTVATATTSDLRGYLGDLAERSFKPASVARRLSAIRQLYRVLYAENHRRQNRAFRRMQGHDIQPVQRRVSNREHGRDDREILRYVVRDRESRQ